MLRKGDFKGSMYELGDDQLRQLLNSATYRGLDSVAAAIKREQVKRIRPANDVDEQEATKHG
jgi:ribosomal protein L7Ae-like RNA K-turn-binding protein